ncbi:MAG: bifunctional metallophosphatase/5'-nucleotidase [Bacteriovoracia bacterium]
MSLRYLYLLPAIFLLTAFSNCSSYKRAPDNDLYKRKGHWRLYSQPEWNPKLSQKLDEGVKRIIVASTNDIHGHINPQTEVSVEKESPKVKYKVGGAAAISTYLNILKSRYPDQVVLVDAGDAFQGTIIANKFKGKPLIKFFNYMGYDALTIGNHEFDYGPVSASRVVAKPHDDPQGALKAAIAESKAPYVASNILSLTNGKPLDWQNTLPYVSKKINDVKIGFLGMTTLQTPNSVVSSNIKGLYFDDPVKNILKYSKILRDQGAKIIILLAHAGTSCGATLAAKHGIEKEKFNFNPNNNSICDKEGELFKTLEKLPPGVIDGVVSGHTHDKIANFINKIPVIQSYPYGKYFARMELFYDEKNDKVLNNKTIIHQPIKLCHQFFKASEDCHGKDSAINHQKTIPATFLGKTIVPDPLAEEVLKPYNDKINEMSQEVIINSPIPLRRNRDDGPNPLGYIVAKAMAQMGNTKIALTNSGGLRANLPAGDITYNDIFTVLPFDNYLVNVKLTGQQLIDLIKIGTSGHDVGNIVFYGLKVWIDSDKDKSISKDWNNDGIKSSWERNRLVKVTLANGNPIKLNKVYTITTQDFMAIASGDNYGNVFNNIPKEEKKIDYDHSYRDSLVRFFRNKKNNSQQIKEMVKKSYQVFNVINK